MYRCILLVISLVVFALAPVRQAMPSELHIVGSWITPKRNHPSSGILVFTSDGRFASIRMRSVDLDAGQTVKVEDVVETLIGRWRAGKDGRTVRMYIDRTSGAPAESTSRVVDLAVDGDQLHSIVRSGFAETIVGTAWHRVDARRNPGPEE